MSRLFALSSLACVLLFPAGSTAAELGQVQTVYLLPMGNGLDQFIAHQLTRHGVFKVTTDPKAADAIFSDVVGLGFENRMAELMPRVEESPKTEDEQKEAEKKKEDELGAGGMARVQTFGRSKGNVFLIDVKTRQVLWTGFDIPKNTRTEEIYKMGNRLIEQLRKDLGMMK